MDQNIAAFLDESAYTVTVEFLGTKLIREVFITNIPNITVGDTVVVPVTNDEAYARLTSGDSTAELIGKNARLRICRVIHVDTSVEIEPSSDKAYGWVVQVIDVSNYNSTIERNRRIASVTANAYKKSLRQSFASRILSELGDDEKSDIIKLLGKSE